MKTLDSIAELEALYGAPKPPAIRKVARQITPEYRSWIRRARFCLLGTVGPEGLDVSPRGDDGPVVAELDEITLALPDWRGNDRIDSLRNILRDPRASLLFMVPGANNVIRVNGRAAVSADPDLLARFNRAGKLPRSVALLRVGEVYFQCARALMRARLWSSGDESAGLPSPGDILAAMSGGEVGGAPYDAAWPERAKASMW